MESRPQISSSGFTVGICATGSPARLGSLMEQTIAEADESLLDLRKMVVVASECAAPVVAELRRVSGSDPRIQVVVENRRYGKADAVNKIQALAEGPLLVMINSDASPELGAITRLLRTIGPDSNIGALSAVPYTEGGRGITPLLLDLMWSTHNACSLSLNHMNLSNHSCDELVVFRISAISRLPGDLVNDGAYLAATARRKGYSVRVCAGARVKIQTPARIPDVVRQRRRILFGHGQVWKKVGAPPKTLESLLFLSPAIGLKLLISSVASRPKFIFTLPVAVVSELAASILAVWDAVRSTNRHVIWVRFE